MTANQAATIEFSGGNTPKTVPAVDFGPRLLGPDKPVVVGTFASSFDPLVDLSRYAVDTSGNFTPAYYFEMVGHGDFHPLGQATTTGTGRFSGVATASGVAGQRLWMVLWDSSNQGDGNSILVSSFSDNNWIVGGDGSVNRIDIAEADQVIFGFIENGRVTFAILPIPEPGAVSLAVLGGLLWGAGSLMRRRTA